MDTGGYMHRPPVTQVDVQCKLIYGDKYSYSWNE